MLACARKGAAVTFLVACTPQKNLSASLRTADGHMKMSEGQYLPIFKPDQGEAFAAGDVRAQENPDLTALQVLFVRA